MIGQTASLIAFLFFFFSFFCSVSIYFWKAKAHTLLFYDGWCRRRGSAPGRHEVLWLTMLHGIPPEPKRMIQLCENSCFCEEIEGSRQEAQPSDSHHGPVKMETRATRGGLQCLRKDREHEEAEGQSGGRGRIWSNIRLRVIRVIEAEGSQFKSRSLCNKLSNDTIKVCFAVHWPDIL